MSLGFSWRTPVASSPRRRGGRSSSLRWRNSRRDSANPNELPDRAELHFFERLQPLFSLPPTTVPKRVTRLCAADAAYSGREVVSAAALSVNGAVTKSRLYRGMFTFPYVGGLFYLHEGPFVVAAVERLQSKPQLVCFDAHGRAHPRSAGLATIAGMVLGV